MCILYMYTYMYIYVHVGVVHIVCTYHSPLLCGCCVLSDLGHSGACTSADMNKGMLSLTAKIIYMYV